MSFEKAIQTHCFEGIDMKKVHIDVVINSAYIKKLSCIEMWRLRE